MLRLLALVACATLPNHADDGGRLAVIQSAPPFDLIDQNGRRVKSEDLREDVWLVAFIFTTCNGTCPATTHRMAKVYEALDRKGWIKEGKVRLISISLYPERDTPAALRRYMQLYEIDGTRWTFLTGPPSRVRKVIASWGMWARPAGNAQLDHPSRIFLVDQDRNIREIYSLGFMRTEWVVEDIADLLGRK